MPMECCAPVDIESHQYTHALGHASSFGNTVLFVGGIDRHRRLLQSEVLPHILILEGSEQVQKCAGDALVGAQKVYLGNVS